MASAPQKPMQFQNAINQDAGIDPEMEAFERRARMRAESQYTGEMGEAWAKRYEDELGRLPKGTHVVINCRIGAFVTGQTSLEAIDEFERRFGRGQTLGYMIEIGGGAFIGGGIV
jgi:hypothetical protein